MRTTVDLPNDLLSEAMERAAREGRSLSEVVSDAVRSSFVRAARAECESVELPTFDGGGLRPGVALDDSAALFDLIDRDS